METVVEKAEYKIATFLRKNAFKRAVWAVFSAPIFLRIPISNDRLPPSSLPNGLLPHS